MPAAWPDRRLIDLFGIEHPILLAPMAGPGGAGLAIEVSRAGGLGALPCAMLSVEAALAALEEIRAAASGPVNLNFFCHTPPEPDAARMAAWMEKLAPYYAELGLDPLAPAAGQSRQPFDEAFCALVETARPEVVSFHFGLPAPVLTARVKAAGAKVIASATNVREARWLEDHGCDAVIAMGLEAGGHRGHFLSDDMGRQSGTLALVPQVVDAVSLPVIAAGGIADARGVAAALALGAAGAQIGTAYLHCPEAKLSPAHRAAIASAAEGDTALTNLFSGRPARGVVNRLMRDLGPLRTDLPPFPLAAGPLAPLRARAETLGRADFTPLWAGQAVALGRPEPAFDLTRRLAEETLALIEWRVR